MRILVVEDDQNLAKSLKRLLEKEGYAVDIAFTGNEAYEIIFGEEYDLILLDLGLPEIDGIKLAEELRKEEKSTPIIMLTARDTVNDKIIGFKAGADDYLVKPFEFDELLARIQALLRRPKSLVPILLKADTLTVDVQSKTAKRNDRQLNLTAKEYSLLEYLIRNKGILLTKQQIIDHVWNNDLDPFSNTVDVYVGYLRSKIDKAFPKEMALLKTIKGMGYKLG